MSKQYEKFLPILLNGNVVSKQDLEALMATENMCLYRLSAYIWDLKKAGGDIQVTKNGKNVVSYQLKNPEKFRGLSEKKVVATTKSMDELPKANPANMVNSPKKVSVKRAAAKKEAQDGEITSFSVDSDFDGEFDPKNFVVETE